MPIELVVFDLAGTTVKDRQDVHRVLQHALLQHGVAVSLEDANEVMGIPKPVAIDQLLRKRYDGDKVVDAQWIAAIHSDFVEAMISFYKTDPGVEETEGTSETFLSLKRNGRKVFVDTGFDRAIANALLERLGWLRNGLIDGSVTSDEVPRGRPFPDMVFRAMERAAVHRAGNVAKVGDTTSDLREGQSAGCGLIIGITTGAHPKHLLSAEVHTHLIDHIGQVQPIVSAFS